ncbi:MAG TPA: (Fe-S)-binding protein [Syntrophorhabdus sp.]|jgi:Fe-S oxidoreductase|nr:(Fe-S)-binding protein [Syntrophorhabdus sp.]
MRIEDISKKSDQIIKIRQSDLLPLPYPYNNPEKDTAMRELSSDQRERYEASLDGVIGVGIQRPSSKAEEELFIHKFLSGLAKLFEKENNWTFLHPLYHSLEYCVKCQICNDSCPAYIASGRKEIYRPTYRPEVLRRIVDKYIKKKNRASLKLTGSDIELNWTLIARLGELAYRCTLCRKCTQACPLGIDNGLISHEIRKVFSQEMGIAPKELHEQGTVQQLKVGSSTGINPRALENIIEFMEDDIEEKIGRKIKIPVDKKGAEILLLHNAGEFMSWPENTEAFAIIFDAAGIDWTLSSETVGYDAVNYGVWYDDIQLARVATRQAEIARNLGVKKINVGECGHAHKAMIVVADRVLTGDLNIPRESALPILRDIVVGDKIKLDSSRNNFPITLHDPCNMVRLMGIVEPQREILKKICPQFLEMEPHGVDNYCCGGGSGFAIMQSMNFPDWRSAVSGRIKLKQILEVFQDTISPDVKKYVCAPCSNCKGQIRDFLHYYNVWDECGIFYGGLAELIVNAMIDLEKPFIEWEWH